MKKCPIDLSCLTEEEISQFQEDPYTLYNGDQDVALYLRYSSTGQSDQSIEGQLRDCRTFCKANHYRIVAIYVDRATTAHKDVEKRVHLMEMVADSAKRNWEYVIVWKLDRFARNRNDSAIMKMRLRKNGVKVLSATEHLTDSPESIILESVLEGMAEFFSAELSQKVTRGMRESALKCHSVGGHIPLGYKVENHKLVVDPDTAHIVQEAFSLYANGKSVADICRKFNSAGYKTAKNTEFNRSSFKAMFRNTRYIGTYTYKDIVIENGIPAIIDKELFETVQRRLSKTATAPARGKAKVDYLLSGKLFCGHCGAPMNGESGAGRHGKVYHYYSCYTKKRKLGCDKRPLKKDYIEEIVARDALDLLTDQLIDEIADMAIRQSEEDLINDTHIPQLTAQLSEVEKSITNITAAIEKGIASETLMNRLVQLEHEKKTLSKELKSEERFVYQIDRDQIVFWLSQFKYGNIEDEDFRRRLIDLLVNSVTVWDEPDGYKITTAYNLTSCKTKTFRVEKNPAAEEATGFGFGESECTMSVLSGSCVQGTAEGLFLCILSENCAYETEKEDAMKHFFRSMLALALVFGMLALCACSKKNDPIPNVRDDPQDQQEPQPGGDPGSGEPQGRKVEPLPSDLTLDGLTDAALAAVPDLASAKEQGGKALLELTVYDTEHYDIVDIATLQPGDIVVSGGREFTVETLQQDEFGGVTINGGVGLDGLQLSTQENDNGYFSVGLDGEANYYEAGRLTLPLAKDFTFVDASDISQPEQTRSAAELLALAGSTDDPGFSPVSTTVMVENGQIRQILRISLP